MSRIGYDFEQTYHPLPDFCKPIAMLLVPDVLITAWNGNIMRRFLPWLQQLRSCHWAQLIFLALQSSSYASLPLA